MWVVAKKPCHKPLPIGVKYVWVGEGVKYWPVVLGAVLRIRIRIQIRAFLAETESESKIFVPDSDLDPVPDPVI
jgi:hypothetical protein